MAQTLRVGISPSKLSYVMIENFRTNLPRLPWKYKVFFALGNGKVSGWLSTVFDVSAVLPVGECCRLVRVPISIKWSVLIFFNGIHDDRYQSTSVSEITMCTCANSLLIWTVTMKAISIFSPPTRQSFSTLNSVFIGTYSMLNLCYGVLGQGITLSLQFRYGFAFLCLRHRAADTWHSPTISRSLKVMRAYGLIYPYCRDIL